MKSLLLSFVLAVLLLGCSTGCTWALAYYTDRPAYEYQAKMLDSLNRLPQFDEVYITTEISSITSKTDIHYNYVLNFRCKAGYRYNSITDLAILSTDIFLNVLHGKSVFENTCFHYENAGGKAYNVCMQPPAKPGVLVQH